MSGWIWSEDRGAYYHVASDPQTGEFKFIWEEGTPMEGRNNFPQPTYSSANVQATVRQWHTCSIGCDGFDCKFGPNERLPFESRQFKGRGAFGVVYSARSTINSVIYATKEMIWTSNQRNRMDKISEEIGIHRRVKHKHITKVVGTYQHTREGVIYAGVVMLPLARCDLSTYLDEMSKLQPNSEQFARDSSVLLDSFGCLASGLAYLHGKSVKHKDIKPQNILLHNGILLLTDFGLSRDFSDTGHSTSVGSTGCTKKFAAPEVLGDMPCRRSADIFSLGCVFLEMFVVLTGNSVTELKASLPKPDSLYSDNISILNEWASWISQSVGHQGQRRFASTVVMSMLSENESSRPTASEVWQSARTKPRTQDGGGRVLCGSCCMERSF